MENRNAIGSQSLDAEKALSVGDACPEAMYDVADIARSFYSEKHRIIYRAMLELMKKEPIDLLLWHAWRKGQPNRWKNISTELVSVVPHQWCSPLCQLIKENVVLQYLYPLQFIENSVSTSR